jgi:CheY-like chemotaxis protein
MAAGGRVLVVDDERLNRTVLRAALTKQGHDVVEAVDGREALDRLAEGPIDVVLLDIMMPVMDGYAALAAIKADPELARIPVIIISGVDDVASVVRCIEMGATDYLPKPFQPAILQARLDASLAAKRLRDLELEYLEQVSRVTGAAAALEAGAADLGDLASVAARDDALGVLARRFESMAREVQAREASLRAQVRELRIEIDHARQARQVAEITESDFFRDLSGRAADLRRIIRDGDTD